MQEERKFRRVNSENALYSKNHNLNRLLEMEEDNTDRSERVSSSSSAPFSRIEEMISPILNKPQKTQSTSTPTGKMSKRSSSSSNITVGTQTLAKERVIYSKPPIQPSSNNSSKNTSKASIATQTSSDESSNSSNDNILHISVNNSSNSSEKQRERAVMMMQSHVTRSRETKSGHSTNDTRISAIEELDKCIAEFDTYPSDESPNSSSFGRKIIYVSSNSSSSSSSSTNHSLNSAEHSTHRRVSSIPVVPVQSVKMKKSTSIIQISSSSSADESTTSSTSSSSLSKTGNSSSTSYSASSIPICKTEIHIYSDVNNNDANLESKNDSVNRIPDYSGSIPPAPPLPPIPPPMPSNWLSKPATSTTSARAKSISSLNANPTCLTSK